MTIHRKLNLKGGERKIVTIRLKYLQADLAFTFEKNVTILIEPSKAAKTVCQKITVVVKVVRERGIAKLRMREKTGGVGSINNKSPVTSQ